MEKKTIKLTESKLREMVEACVKETILQDVNEDFLGGLKQGAQGILDKGKEIGNRLRSKFDAIDRGYEIKDGQPQRIEDVFLGDGWKDVKMQNKGTERFYFATKATGSFGSFHGKEIPELVDDLNIYLNGKATASYAGTSPNKKYRHIFKVVFN